jgi:arginine N-succinyltransferase
MLERIGFRYVDRVDPFDGGPHFEADTDSLTLVSRYRTLKVAEEDLDSEAREMLVGVARKSPRNRFRAVRSLVRIDEKFAFLPREAKALLDIQAGARISVVPFE